MLQQYHWITGWWQPRCERPLSFVEDDKLRPGEDVTSSKRRHKNSMKCAIAKFLNQDGRPDRYWKLKRMMENSANQPPTRPEREHTVTEVSPKSPCCVISLGRRPSCQQNPKNGPKDEETQKFAYFACAT